MSVKNLNKENFEREILNNAGISLVDFYADWCGPCKMMSPIVDEIAEECTDINVGKINVDESQELAVKYGVASIPTLIIFKDRNEVDRIVGFKPKESILDLLK